MRNYSEHLEFGISKGQQSVNELEQIHQHESGVILLLYVGSFFLVRDYRVSANFHDLLRRVNERTILDSTC